MGVCCHDFVPAAEHPEYVRCVSCGTYMSTTAPPTEQVYTADYWSHERGHSTLEEQVYNCEEHLEGGKSKNDFLLSLISVEDCSAALDIGCAPGTLLRRLSQDHWFDFICGIEAVADFGPAIESEVDGYADGVSFGFFPFVTKEWDGGIFSLIVAADVFEHSHEPWPFLLECSRLLKKGGQIILMMPMVVPGEEVPARMFSPEEHVWIHSMDNLAALLGQAGFHTISFDRWCPGHETVTARKGEMPECGLKEPRV